MARFSHILVQHEYEAKDLLRLLQQGRDFAALASKHSQCSSAAVGGDLGELKPGKADQDFEEVAFTLKPGQYTSSPVRTRFGYHLILRTS